MFLIIMNHKTGKSEIVKMEGFDKPKKESLKNLVFARTGHEQTSFILTTELPEMTSVGKSEVVNQS